VILEEVLYNTLSVSVGHRNNVASLRMPSLSPFGVQGCPILILHMVILRITDLIVVVSICPGLVHVGNRVPVVLRLPF
jgi:hypothetical protein